MASAITTLIDEVKAHLDGGTYTQTVTISTENLLVHALHEITGYRVVIVPESVEPEKIDRGSWSRRYKLNVIVQARAGTRETEDNVLELAEEVEARLEDSQLTTGNMVDFEIAGRDIFALEDLSGSLLMTVNIGVEFMD